MQQKGNTSFCSFALLFALVCCCSSTSPDILNENDGASVPEGEVDFSQFFGKQQFDPAEKKAADDDMSDLFRQIRKANPNLDLHALDPKPLDSLLAFDPLDNDLHCSACNLVANEIQHSVQKKLVSMPPTLTTLSETILAGIAHVCPNLEKAGIILVGKMARPRGLVRGKRRFRRHDLPYDIDLRFEDFEEDENILSEFKQVCNHFTTHPSFETRIVKLLEKHLRKQIKNLNNKKNNKNKNSMKKLDVFGVDLADAICEGESGVCANVRDGIHHLKVEL